MIFQPLFPPLTLILFGAAWFTVVVLAYLRYFPATAGRNRRIPAAVRRSLLGAVIIAAFMGPSVPLEVAEVASNIEVFLAVDRTGSMAAEDWEDGSPRLDGVRRDIELLLDATAGSRYSAISWDSHTRVEMPITTDASAIASFAELLHQEISDYSSGSSMNRPVEVLIDELQSSMFERPANIRLLLVFTDGESTDDADPTVNQSAWRELGEMVDGGAVLGYGTDEGGPMLEYVSGSGTGGTYIVDPDNPSENALSYVDEESLQAMADALELPLFLNPTAEQVQTLGEEMIRSAELTDDGRNLLGSYRLAVWPLGIAAALLSIWELFALTGTITRLRSTNAI